MKRFVIGKLGAVFALGILALSAGDARAQIKFGPNGQIGIPNLFGTHTWIHPDRLNPLANIPITPPQTPPGVMGQTWLGADNKPHGNVFDPNTGDFHMFKHTSPGGGGNSFLLEDEAAPAPAHSRAHFQVQSHPGEPIVQQPWLGGRRTPRPAIRHRANFHVPLRRR
jgi:hypothetical protein